MADSEQKFKVGEVIRVRDRIGFIPEAEYQVQQQVGEMLHLSAGEILVGAKLKTLLVIARNLPLPKSWLRSEIAVLSAQVERCGCPDCLQDLRAKRQQLEQEMVH